MSAPALRLARPDEQGRVLAFINEHFDWRLPVVNRPEWFRFYFQSGDALQFALAEQKGKLAAVAGYILASRGPCPDVWVSVWVARKGCNGAGLELAAVDLRQAMACLGEITGDQVEERLLDEVFGRFCVGK